MPTRIGVNCGEVTLGTMGVSFHFEYRAMGDTVNTASGVEQLNKDLGTRLLVTAALIEELDAFLVCDLGSFQLRGRRAPTRICELIARADQARPEQRALCAAFTEALGAYERGQADAARAGFEALVEAHEDGPSAYCLRLLEP
jgi:adenylate cyclase